jgi:hypothetical protein
MEDSKLAQDDDSDYGGSAKKKKRGQAPKFNMEKI